MIRLILPVLIFLLILSGFDLANIDPEQDQPAEEDTTWLVTYDGTMLPQEQGWTPVGTMADSARVGVGGLRIVDDTYEQMGAFRMAWTPDSTKEIIVEARVRVESVTANPRGTPGGTMLYWPSTQGWPSGLLVSDGRHQEGLVLHTYKISTFLDRVVMMDARSNFHTYRLVIRGNDMSIYVDGERKIRGEGAFWKPADTTEAFVQFGSNSEKLMGESYWSWVRLGIHDLHEQPEPPRLQVTISEPWDIPSLPRDNPYMRPYRWTSENKRPFVHDMGQGMLLMRVGQGPDAVYEPSGVLISKDEGRIWNPVKNMQYKSLTPLSMTRMENGKIIACSQRTSKYEGEDGIFIGMTYYFDEETETFETNESLIRVPEKIDMIVFKRQIFDIGNNEILASVQGKSEVSGKSTMLLKSVDEGLTWTYFSTTGARQEPVYARFSDTEMMGILRTGGWQPFEQVWSDDGGKTWSSPVTMEEGSVSPDLVYMSNGVLACSYGRNGSNLMFSLDKGKTWVNHKVITDAQGYNYTSIREVSPGRLLYVHDAPNLQALYVDIEPLVDVDATVWVASPWHQVLRSTPPGDLQSVSLRAAANEYEPFRLIVHNNSYLPIKEVNVTVSSLTGSKGEIPIDNTRLFRAHYLHITEPSYRTNNPVDWYPDALIPFEDPNFDKDLGDVSYLASPFRLEGRQNAEVWCDLFVPPGTLPGMYHGTATVTVGEDTLNEIPVDLEVWDFELPERISFRSRFGSLRANTVKMMGIVAGSEENYAMEELFNQYLLKHRAVPGTPNRFWPGWNESAGIIEQGEAERMRQLVEVEHFNALQIPFAYKSEPEKCRSYLSAMANWLRDLGYLNMAYIYLKDEPNNAEEYEIVRQQGALISSADTDIARMCTEQTVPSKPDWGDLYGAVDIWCPLWGLWDEPTARERLDKGEDLWSYTALCQGPEGTPWWQIDVDPLNFRSPFWLSWHYDITGFLYWSGVYWSAYETLQGVWEAPYFRELYWGEGMLLYPGQPAGIKGFVPSIRLKLYREAMEDYEYMVMAADRGMSEEVDSIINTVVTSFQNWSRERENYKLGREALADLILNK